ncbi:hypothetical protein RESH_03080 [Rhodopirellula europaea SH398]|uniref:Uncharacterized protein n=1 Tax=Rhodopirellula europaea SH398 TaxID=1263868 RepID=M5SJ94_9BACT|nr:hypothetical protein RESH_03080 [Rhodopirellula europaea SH398]
MPQPNPLAGTLISRLIRVATSTHQPLEHGGFGKKRVARMTQTNDPRGLRQPENPEKH